MRSPRSRRITVRAGLYAADFGCVDRRAKTAEMVTSDSVAGMIGARTGMA